MEWNRRGGLRVLGLISDPSRHSSSRISTFLLLVLITFRRGIQATGSSTPHINSNMTEAPPEAGPSTPRISQQTSPDEPSSAFERWRSSLAAFTGLGMSEEQKLEQAALNENKKLEKDWNACEKLKQDLMETSEFSNRSCTVWPSTLRLAHSHTHSLFIIQAKPDHTDPPGPIVVFMLKHLKLSGCAFPSSAIQCHPCEGRSIGGFHHEFGVLLCQDRLQSRKIMEDTIAHELIHAYDHCKFNIDWYNLRHHACTEVSGWSVVG
jgi:hypothetical protein